MSMVTDKVGIGPYTFFEMVDNGFPDHAGKTLWTFTIEGQQHSSTLYATLDHAMVAAVGERHTGPRGANGPGVDTAAGWFMKMIGADQIKQAGSQGTRALADVLSDIAGDAGNQPTACGIERRLGERGVILARS